MSRILLISSLIFFLISGCKSKSNPVVPPSIPQNIMPLSVGNYWKYQRVYYDPNGNITNVDTFKVAITKDTIINFTTWFFDDYFWIYYNNKSDGLWIYSNISSWLMWKYPAQIGETYYAGSDTVKVISTDKALTTLIGVYHCYSYEYNFRGLPIDTFISPGLGIVYSESAISINNGKPYIDSKSYLIDYKIE